MENVVLLVDDERNVLHGLARVLRHQPYRLYTATSGEEAQMVLMGHSVDLIVADEHMPGMSGGDLLAWVAKHYPEVIRLVLTGCPTVKALIRAINEGAVHQFFTKPCDAIHLAMTIRKALEYKALVTENRRLLETNKEPDGADRRVSISEEAARSLVDDSCANPVAREIQESGGAVGQRPGA